MIKLSEKTTSDVTNLDNFQQACNETYQYEESVRENFQPVFDALNSYPKYHQTTDAYAALAKAEESLVMAYLILNWAIMPPMKLTADIANLDNFQQDHNETYKELAKDRFQPVFDVFNSYPEYHQTTDAYAALAKAEKRLVVAYFILNWARENSLTIEDIFGRLF